jgi:poly(3-hydroxyalkanoate) synthetase
MTPGAVVYENDLIQLIQYVRLRPPSFERPC